MNPLTRLLPLLNVLPVQPAEIYELRGRSIPRSPRRLYLKPMPGDEGRDLLRLDESIPGDTAGWEEYFTDRKAYSPNPDVRAELNPTRGFYSAYPVKGNQANDIAFVLAEYAEYVEGEGKATRPWLVLTKPDVPWRAGYLASGEIYRMIGFDKKYYDQVVTIPGPLGIEWSRKLAAKEGIFTGISGGATFAAAMQVAEKAAAGSTILCMLPDTGERYLTTPLFNGIEAEMNEEEIALSRSTPGAQFPVE